MADSNADDNALKILLEVYFLKFYKQVIEKEIHSAGEKSDNDSMLRMNQDCLKKVVDAFDYKVPDVNTSTLYFDFPEIRCAYIFQYGICFSSSVAYHFRKLLENDFKLFQKLTSQNTLTICCLGGGPATEVVAITKALEMAMFHYNFRSQRPLHVNAIIIDIDSGWLKTAETMIQRLSSHIHSSKMKFSLSFIEADLTMPFSEDVRNAVNESDIVTMIKFLSALHGTEEGCRTPEMMKEIIGNIREDGMLFFMDSSFLQHVGVFRSAMGSFDCMTEIYGPVEYDTYEMSPLSKRECLALFSMYYGNRYCACKTRNHVSVSYKMNCYNSKKSITVSFQQPATGVRKSRVSYSPPCPSSKTMHITVSNSPDSEQNRNIFFVWDQQYLFQNQHLFVQSQPLMVQKPAFVTPWQSRAHQEIFSTPGKRQLAASEWVIPNFQKNGVPQRSPKRKRYFL